MNPDLKIDSLDRLEAWKQGQSFLTPRDLTLDWKNIAALYKRLVELVKRRADGCQQEKGLLNAITKMENGAPVLIKAVLASDVKAIRTFSESIKHRFAGPGIAPSDCPWYRRLSPSRKRFSSSWI